MKKKTENENDWNNLIGIDFDIISGRVKQMEEEEGGSINCDKFYSFQVHPPQCWWK